MQLSVNDAAEFFGVSKEAIHNRIRRGSLEVVVENGVKMVKFDESQSQNLQKSSTPKREQTQLRAHDERYYRLLEEQNARLQKRVEALEDETRSLRDQKELMLIAEREKIESIYKEKDEQLKNILATLSQQFMLTLSNNPNDTNLYEQETFDAEIDEPSSGSNIVSLKKFLKSLGLPKSKTKKLKEEFLLLASSDKRFIIFGEKIYLDTLRYDYSDLL
jgi:hypothetical protein